jgi:glycerol-3-phosphate dehydrogenase
MQPLVLIIGGGVTGTGLARDLALRGVPSVLVEKRDINAGASGGNHGLLHSGARYVSTDEASAAACQEEAELLRRLAPHCIEDTGGLFVAVPGDDEGYIAEFPDLCSRSSIACRALEPKEARSREPSLSPRIIAAYEVNDATINPFQLSLENLNQAIGLGATYLGNHEVLDLRLEKGRIAEAVLRHSPSGRQVRMEPDIVINATGAWASRVAALVGVSIPMQVSKGTLAVTHSRMSNGVVNRLRPPNDGDILVPGGNVSILGTTSLPVDDLDSIRPTVTEVDQLVEEGAAMMPALEDTRYIRAYAGARPLLNAGESPGDTRAASRGFSLFDHAEQGVANCITITGGKLTTYRLMAERTADLATEKLGIEEPCRTRSEPLPSTPSGRWSEPKRSSRAWLESGDPGDMLLCECEMIPESHFQEVLHCLTESCPSQLNAFKLRSRMGKGACQGSFCSLRVTGSLYNQGRLSGRAGLQQIKDFMQKRWIGQRPILWDGQLVQAELAEAIHCGLLGLESFDPDEEARLE